MRVWIGTLVVALIGLAGALMAITPAAASGCDSQASEGSVYAVYITCAPEFEPDLIIVPPRGPCPVPPPGRCDTPETVELGVDCTEPFTVSLPDDVLTECETE